MDMTASRSVSGIPEPCAARVRLTMLDKVQALFKAPRSQI